MERIQQHWIYQPTACFVLGFIAIDSLSHPRVRANFNGKMLLCTGYYLIEKEHNHEHSSNSLCDLGAICSRSLW